MALEEEDLCLGDRLFCVVFGTLNGCFVAVNLDLQSVNGVISVAVRSNRVFVMSSVLFRMLLWPLLEITSVILCCMIAVAAVMC